MRIAYLTQAYPPMVSGAAISVQQLAETMAGHGHQILVIAASDRKYPYNSYGNNLTIMRLNSFHNPMRVGQRILVYPHQTILQALRKFRPDVIHAHEPLISWIGFNYAQRANVPITLTVHMLPWSAKYLLPDIPGVRSFAEDAAWMYLRLMARKFSSVITSTRMISEVVTRETSIQAETIPCGINMQTFHSRPSPDIEIATRARLNLPLNVPVILHVGRLDPEKRVDQVVLAAAQAMSQLDAHLLIVGDGREKPALIQLCQSLGIGDRAHFPGYISVEEGLPEIYRMASLFVMTSEVESQGIVLLEAAASGLPIAAVNATSISEVVHDGINGYLTVPGEVKALGDAIAALLRSPEKSRQMGREGRIVAENYDIQRTQKLHEQFYERLINQKHIPAARKVTLNTRWKRLKIWMGFSE